MGWISLSGPHPRSQHPTSSAEALGEVSLEVLANQFNSMALLGSKQLGRELAPNTAVLARIG